MRWFYKSCQMLSNGLMGPREKLIKINAPVLAQNMLGCMQVIKMVALSSCEILDELQKLGIKPYELFQYVIEYSAYDTVRHIQPDDLRD
jgi:hypothetical protein